MLRLMSSPFQLNVWKQNSYSIFVLSFCVSGVVVLDAILAKQKIWSDFSAVCRSGGYYVSYW